MVADISDKYTREDWKYEVANDDIVLGYAEWVAVKTEDDEAEEDARLFEAEDAVKHSIDPWEDEG